MMNHTSINQIPSTKSQVSNKFQLPNDRITKTSLYDSILEFRSLEFWALFDYWCLELDYYPFTLPYTKAERGG